MHGIAPAPPNIEAHDPSKIRSPCRVIPVPELAPRNSGAANMRVPLELSEQQPANRLMRPAKMAAKVGAVPVLQTHGFDLPFPVAPELCPDTAMSLTR